MANKKKSTDIKNEIQSLSESEIVSKINETKQQLNRMTFSHAITPIENPMNLRKTRKEIAIMQTALRKKQLGF